MSNKKPPELSLPPGMAEERQQEAMMQQQVIGLRNQLAGEIYIRLLSENVDPTQLDEVKIADLAPVAAFCLEASMVFLEVAGVIRRLPPAANDMQVQ